MQEKVRQMIIRRENIDTEKTQKGANGFEKRVHPTKVDQRPMLLVMRKHATPPEGLKRNPRLEFHQPRPPPSNV